MVVKPKQSADQVQEQKATEQPKTLGRLVLVTGDKGGTGPSYLIGIQSR